MIPLCIGIGTVSAGVGAFIGITAGSGKAEEAVGYSSLALIAVGLFAFGYGLARVLS